MNGIDAAICSMNCKFPRARQRLVITFFPQTGPHVFHPYRGDDEPIPSNQQKGGRENAAGETGQNQAEING